MNGRAATEAPRATARPAFVAAPARLLLRRCACGGAPGADGECATCRARRLARQRASAGAAGPTTAPPLVHEVLRAPGRPLDPATRALMEPRFGHDFSRVRIHTGAHAAASARAVEARAYTVGRDIVFGAGQYAPGTEPGRRLLAHELTHVAQQRRPDRSGAGELLVGAPDDRHEREARRTSQALGASREPAGALLPVAPAAPASVLRRVPVAVGAAAAAAAGFAAGGITFGAALAYGRSLATRYPGWLNVLPNCPCTEAQAQADPTNWEPDRNTLLLFYFHSGAASSYRSKGAFTTVPGSAHGQQCTYDSAGNLITGGAGAGTPDVWAGNRESAKHLSADVATWQVLGWQIYNRYWQPNNGNGCAANTGSQ